MSRSNLDKVLRRIEKSEEKSLKILFKQRKDLLKALEDNERLIESRLNRGATPQEVKLEQEIDKLTKVRVSHNFLKSKTILYSCLSSAAGDPEDRDVCGPREERGPGAAHEEEER